MTKYFASSIKLFVQFSAFEMIAFVINKLTSNNQQRISEQHIRKREISPMSNKDYQFCLKRIFIKMSKMDFVKVFLNDVVSSNK